MPLRDGGLFQLMAAMLDRVVNEVEVEHTNIGPAFTLDLGVSGNG